MTYTRGDLIKLAGCTTTAAFIGGALEAPTAQAMESRVDQTLKLYKDGTVAAAGPITTWNPDETSARVSIIITQTTRVIAGLSTRYPHGTQRWQAWAHVGATRMQPGHALAYATAIILTTSGATEYYSWRVPVTLVRA